MKEYAKRPQSPSRTLNSNPRASRQAPVADMLQSYKNGTLGRQPVQRESVEDEELLQAKTSGQVPISVILQRYNESIQRYTPEEDDELLQGFNTVQREETDKNELLQGKFEPVPAGEQKTVQREEKPNNTGLPDNLKSGIENLSGYSMDDVRVHYNSSKPAQLQALAYAQGSDIHIAPGQEQHLPHEAWHVVQQKQGRVQPTMQMQGVNVNDNQGLEKEADVMGGKAVQMKNINILTPVVQRVTQNQAEIIMSDRLGIEDEIKNYGGLCGGWSMALLHEEEALNFWEKLESLETRGLLLSPNVVGWDNFFIKVMKYQYELDRSDTDLYDSENEERRENLLSLKEALEKVGEKVFWDKDAAKYDINNRENIKKNNWSILKEYIIERGGVLIATETHFMSVKLLNKNTFVVSETNSIGYKCGTWEEVTNYLDKEITGEVSLKFFPKTKPKLGKKQMKNLLQSAKKLYRNNKL